ncbi:MAG: exodeoxyribonuclease VII large subunit [Caldilineaceae bacterium]
MEPITVSKLTTHIVGLFERDDTLRDVWVTGEVSNWKRAASGHVYFRLKDSGATINAVMWKGAASAHSWLPRDGDQVLAHGYVGVYPEGGAYQLYANILRPAGKGQLYARFEELKAKLQAAGLFEAERKRPIPIRPRRLGVVTSPDAAALRDILRVLSLRWPMVDVLVFPCLVQGAESPGQIVSAIAAANRYHVEVAPIDTLIVARGGGSIEDLWSFNDERVAYAIAGSSLPVVSGVGHETDFTIADFVADLRAPTPSAAAAAVTPDRAELLGQLAAREQWLAQQAVDRLAQESWELQHLAGRLQRVHPGRRLDQRIQSLDDRTRRLQGALQRRLAALAQARLGAERRLQALSPLHVLQRGYSIVQHLDGGVVTAPEGAAAGEPLLVRAAGGQYRVIKSE